MNSNDPMPFERLQPAQLRDAEQPFSDLYGDVYHSTAGALAQAEHVFLQGNGLPKRWQGRERFTICETGFGLGLNFLALWQAWRADPQRCARLHVISVEAHPLTGESLAQWHERLLEEPWLALATALREQWPELTPGLHRLEFEQGAVTLTLGLGRAEALLPRIDAAVDAFLLDGFAPSRNPDMWSRPVLTSLSHLANTHATLATWSSAGHVRRGLEELGFDVQKRPGFAGKRDMTVASWRHEPGPTARAALSRECRPGRAAVLGGGLAGSSAAAALARRGWEVVVYDPAACAADEHAEGSHHPAAALSPVPDAGDSPRARLLRLGAQRALQQWRPWLGAVEDLSAPVRRTGTFQVAGPRVARSADTLLAWQEDLAALGFPRGWLQVTSAAEASRQVGQAVGRDGVWLSGGLVVQPGALARAWLHASSVAIRGQAIGSWRAVGGGGWELIDRSGMPCDQVDLLVLAAGPASADLWQASYPQRPLPAWAAAWHRVAGQVAWVSANQLAAGAPQAIVAGEGYVLPPTPRGVVVGSSYDHDAVWPHPAPLRWAEWPRQWNRLTRLLPANHARQPPTPQGGWAGWRAVLPDRLPLVDWLAPGLAMIGAMGSRGLAWSAWAGDLLAGDLAGEPALLTIDLRVAVSAARFDGAATH